MKSFFKSVIICLVIAICTTITLIGIANASTGVEGNIVLTDKKPGGKGKNNSERGEKEFWLSETLGDGVKWLTRQSGDVAEWHKKNTPNTYKHGKALAKVGKTIVIQTPALVLNAFEASTNKLLCGKHFKHIASKAIRDTMDKVNDELNAAPVKIFNNIKNEYHKISLKGGSKVNKYYTTGRNKTDDGLRSEGRRADKHLKTIMRNSRSRQKPDRNYGRVANFW